jgi:hypothetical protein
LSAEWAKDVRIQAGAPLFPRVQAIVCGLLDRRFSLGAAGRPISRRYLIEIFPSASIGILGAHGFYYPSKSADVRSYKRLRHFATLELATCIALRPLIGFQQCLGPQTGELARKIGSRAAETVQAGARRSKEYVDIIDAGIAFLTACCLSVNAARWIGDGSDGAILTPGLISDPEHQKRLGAQRMG